jgi:hypothetical protein
LCAGSVAGTRSVYETSMTILKNRIFDNSTPPGPARQ